MFWTQVSASEKLFAKDGPAEVFAEAAATLRAPDAGLQAPARPLPPEEPGALGGWRTRECLGLAPEPRHPSTCLLK